MKARTVTLRFEPEEGDASFQPFDVEFSMLKAADALNGIRTAIDEAIAIDGDVRLRFDSTSGTTIEMVCNPQYASGVWNRLAEASRTALGDAEVEIARECASAGLKPIGERKIVTRRDDAGLIVETVTRPIY